MNKLKDLGYGFLIALLLMSAYLIVVVGSITLGALSVLAIAKAFQ